MQRRKRGADRQHCEVRESGWGHDASRRRVQTTHFAIRLPGAWQSGARHAFVGKEGDGTPYRDGADGLPGYRALQRRGRHPDRCAEHAEFQSPEGSWRLYEEAYSLEARHERDIAGTSDERRIHHGVRQS